MRQTIGKFAMLTIHTAPVWLTVGFLALVTAGTVSAKTSYTIKSAPSWVESVSIPQPAQSASSDADYLLYDNQIRVSSSATERYSRQVKKVLSAAGLANAAQIQLGFEPSYEELVIHYIRIQRGEQIIDALRPREIKVIQQEDELDQQLYNGRLSAVILLNDVRVGDIIDYAYSVNGDNPVLAGHFVSGFLLSGNYPIEKLRWRLLWPSERSLHFKTHSIEFTPAIRQIGNELEHVWEREHIPATEYDDTTPDWFDPVPNVELSEFANWGEVVNWALPLYETKRALSPALTKQVEQWGAIRALPEVHLIAALRFVQDEVRYTGIEMGPYSHLPNQPSLVFDRRFGDCKDKSLLLVTILNLLGIEARPALVDTEARQTISEACASPFAFNHVIVQAKLGDKTLWLDPTITLQRGDLSQYYSPNYGRALVVRNGTSDLEEIPQPVITQPTTFVKEVYTVESYQSPATLEVTTTYRSMDADTMRYRLARQSIADISKVYLNFYAETDSSIEPLGQLQVNDDQNANTIVVTERYRIPQFWKSNVRDFEAHRINQELLRPNISRRTMPLAIDYPASLSQSIEVRLPERLNIPKASEIIADDWIRFEFKTDLIGNTFKLDYNYQSLRDHVPAAQVTKHLATLDKIQKMIGYRVTNQNEPMDTASSLVGISILGVLFGPMIVFGVIKGVQRARANRKTKEFKQLFHVAEGEGPDSAIPLKREDDLIYHLQSFRSSCGAIYYHQGASLNKESFTFDGRRLIVVRLECERCGGLKDVYFVKPESQA
ncbi:MAG TPA: DUF3857 domain-containing protein [Blastocatellia bacterium]|nr:DUF3857 domain-containing protein [Blastocatellia bacterium]